MEKVTPFVRGKVSILQDPFTNKRVLTLYPDVSFCPHKCVRCPNREFSGTDLMTEDEMLEEIRKAACLGCQIVDIWGDVSLAGEGLDSTMRWLKEVFMVRMMISGGYQTLIRRFRDILEGVIMDVKVPLGVPLGPQHQHLLGTGNPEQYASVVVATLPILRKFPYSYVQVRHMELFTEEEQIATVKFLEEKFGGNFISGE